MKTPGPDHPIILEPATSRWRARFAGHVIADTPNAIILREADYPPVVYFPREDVATEYMGRTDRGTHCPYKGDASYYTLLIDGQFAENGVWSYETPFPAMEPIAGRMAFYADKVEVYPVDDAVVNPNHREPGPQEPRAVDSAVQHTDTGAGYSQREPWAANVTPPATADDGGLR